MSDNGYIVIVKDGWVFKEFSNGEIERIKELDSENLNQELIFD